MEDLIIEIIRGFYLSSGALDGEFDINDFNTSYVDSVIDEQTKINI
ncbi:hypothetical protein [Tenacibaculum sp. C7A-26P2]